jgi:hypothetical protein
VMGAEHKIFGATSLWAKPEKSSLGRDGVGGVEKNGGPRRDIAVQLLFGGLCHRTLNVARSGGRTGGESRADRTWGEYMDWRAVATCRQVLLACVPRAAAEGSHGGEAVQCGWRGDG